MVEVKTLAAHRQTFLMLLLCIAAVYGLTFHQRYAGYALWMEASQETVVDGITAMSGPDSYYWLKMAKELDKGTLGKQQADPTKGYPDGALFAIQDTPSLLAELISFGKTFTGGDYYRSGLMLIPLLAGLFVFPLFFYFNRVGFGASAILGGLVGSFSDAYYARTKIGRVDTDLLNLFFLMAAACFILPISREKSWRANLGLSAGAGLTMLLFTRWYQQPSMILVFLLVMAVYLLMARVSWKQMPLLLLVFLLASGPEYVMQIFGSLRVFLNAYFSPVPTGLIAWPNVLLNVGEAQQRGVLTTLQKLHGLMPVVIAGFAGLLYLGIRHFKRMIPISPLIMLGAWSLVGPNRFAMYLAPFIGVGAGVLVELLVNYSSSKTRLRPQVVPFVSAALMFIIFFSTSAYTGYSKRPLPEIDAPTTRALLDIKRLVPKHSAMFTPYWEFGYPLMEIGEFATYHDGGLQGGMRSTLASIATMSPRQEEMVSLLSYVEDHGFNHLSSTISKEKLSADSMLRLVFDYPGEFSGENVYVIYSEEMIWKMFSMSTAGTWDFEKKKGKPTDYVELNCFSSVDNVMRCRDGTIDLNRGLMNDGSIDISLRAALFVNDGYVVNRRDYENKDGYYLQVLMKKGKIYLILVADDFLFQSNFNQQYLLGNYDKRYFEEVYNNFPVARVLKVKRAVSVPVDTK